MHKENDFYGSFVHGHEVWLKQSKQFFEKSLPLLDYYFARSYVSEEEALFGLDEMIYYFKAHINSEQSFFNFIPQISASNQQTFPKYFSLLSTMTDEAVNLLHEKMREKIKKQQAPQSLRDFYELWLECGETVYQKWLHTEAFLSVFGEMMNGMVRG